MSWPPMLGVRCRRELSRREPSLRNRMLYRLPNAALECVKPEQLAEFGRLTDRNAASGQVMMALGHHHLVAPGRRQLPVDSRTSSWVRPVISPSRALRSPGCRGAAAAWRGAAHPPMPAAARPLRFASGWPRRIPPAPARAADPWAGSCPDRSWSTAASRRPGSAWPAWQVGEGRVTGPQRPQVEEVAQIVGVGVSEGHGGKVPLALHEGQDRRVVVDGVADVVRLGVGADHHRRNPEAVTREPIVGRLARPDHRRNVVRSQRHRREHVS